MPSTGAQAHNLGTGRQGGICQISGREAYRSILEGEKPTRSEPEGARREAKIRVLVRSEPRVLTDPSLVVHCGLGQHEPHARSPQLHIVVGQSPTQCGTIA